MGWLKYFGAIPGAIGGAMGGGGWEGAKRGFEEGALTTVGAGAALMGAPGWGDAMNSGGGYGDGGGYATGATGTSPASNSALSSLDKWSLALQGLGTAASGYGAYQQGKSYDEEMAYRRRIEEEDRARNLAAGQAMSPFLEQYMRGG